MPVVVGGKLILPCRLKGPGLFPVARLPVDGVVQGDLVSLPRQDAHDVNPIARSQGLRRLRVDPQALSSVLNQQGVPDRLVQDDPGEAHPPVERQFRVVPAELGERTGGKPEGRPLRRFVDDQVVPGRDPQLDPRELSLPIGLGRADALHPDGAAHKRGNVLVDGQDRREFPGRRHHLQEVHVTPRPDLSQESAYLHPGILDRPGVRMLEGHGLGRGHRDVAQNLAFRGKDDRDVVARSCDPGHLQVSPRMIVGQVQISLHHHDAARRVLKEEKRPVAVAPGHDPRKLDGAPLRRFLRRKVEHVRGHADRVIVGRAGRLRCRGDTGRLVDPARKLHLGPRDLGIPDRLDPLIGVKQPRLA